MVYQVLSQLPSPRTLTAALWGRQCGIVRLQLCTWGNWGCIAGALTPSSRAGSWDCSVGLSNHILNAVDLQAKCCSLKSYCKFQANKGLLLSSSLLPMCKGVHLYLPEQSLIGLGIQPASGNLLRYSWALILSGKLCLFHFQHNHQWLQILLGRGMDIWEGQLVTRVRGSAGSGRVESWQLHAMEQLSHSCSFPGLSKAYKLEWSQNELKSSACTKFLSCQYPPYLIHPVLTED